MTREGIKLWSFPPILEITTSRKYKQWQNKWKANQPHTDHNDLNVLFVACSCSNSCVVWDDKLVCLLYIIKLQGVQFNLKPQFSFQIETGLTKCLIGYTQIKTAWWEGKMQYYSLAKTGYKQSSQIKRQITACLKFVNITWSKTLKYSNLPRIVSVRSKFFISLSQMPHEDFSGGEGVSRWFSCILISTCFCISLALVEKSGA